MEERNLEIIVKTVNINSNVINSKGKMVVGAVLAYPQVGKSSISSEHMVNKDLVGMEITPVDNVYSQRILFKEKIQGSTSITLSLVRIRKGGPLGKFFSGVVSGLSGLSSFPAKTTLVGTIANAGVSGFAEGLKEDDSDMLAAGIHDIPDVALGDSIDIEVEMKSLSAMTIQNADEDDEDDWFMSDSDVDNDVTLSKGESLGKIVLTVSSI